MKLKTIIEENNTPLGKIFDFFIQFLIIISLISFSIETLPDLDVKIKMVLHSSEIVVVIIFSFEYILRLAVSDRKLKFIFSFFGLIDLCAILPFYISLGIDLRSIRIFRLFRLFRSFKLLRYNRAIQRFKDAILMIKDELIVFLFSTVLLLFFSSVCIFYFEHPAQPDRFTSLFNSLWWAVVTLTSVGYGDIYPITTGGKIFTFFILIIGLGIVAVPTGLIASALTKTAQKDT